MVLSSLDKINDWTEKASSFAEEQTPLIVKEIITWGLVEKLYYMTVGILVILAGYFLYRIFKKLAINHIAPGTDWTESEFSAPAIIFLICGCLIGSICIFCNLYDFIYIYLAPRLYVIDYVAHLVRVLRR